MEVGKKATAFVAKWKVLTLIIFTVHFCMCIANVVVGGIIFFGFRTVKVAAAADGLRYIGHLLSALLAVFLVVCLIIHWGASIVRWLFIVEFLGFLGQFFAWMLDANSAAKIRAAPTAYKLAISSTVMGVFISLITLYLTAALFFQRTELEEMVDEDSTGE